jgi:hypothetical protein
MGSKVIRNISKVLRSAANRIFGAGADGVPVELTPADVRTLLSVSTTAEIEAAYQPIGSYAASVHTHTSAAITDFAEAVDDEVASLLVAGTNITITYNDAGSTLTIASTAGGGLSGTGSVDNAVLRADGTGGAALQSSNLEIADLFTASPNNTINAVCIGPVGGTTNVDFVLKPKGTGAVQAHVADNTAAGGNKRGVNAVDWQTARNSAAQVASGSFSALLGGANNTISQAYSAGGGHGHTINGSWAFGWQRNGSITASHAAGFGYGNTLSADGVFGAGRYNVISGAQSAGFGYYNTASATFCFVSGHWANANKSGQRAQASGRFAVQGDAQGSELVVRNSTSNATQTELFLNGSSARITIANDTTWAFEALIVARRTDADNESAAYRITGCIDRNANAASTALVGTPTVTVISEDTVAWDVDAVADPTNGSLNFRVTGEAAKTIRWVGWVRLTEVTG